MNKFILENAAEPMELNLENISSEELEQLDSLGYLGGDEADMEDLDF